MASARYAPLVFSRTAYIDFRASFLAAPQDLNNADAVRAAVLAALDYADRLDDGPRWCLFGSGGRIVAGVAALASWFSDSHTHELALGAGGVEAPRRRLYAFVGAVWQAEDAPFAPPREQSFYAKIYADVVGPRFYERMSLPGWETPTATTYALAEVDTLDPASALKPDPGYVRISPAVQDERLWRAAAAGRGRVSLCTNAPPGKHKQRETFDMITRADVTDESRELRTSAAPAPSAAPRIGIQRRTVDASMDVAGWDRQQAEKKSANEPPTPAVPVLWIGLALAATAAAAAFLLLGGRR
jgi:hypothetical protein